MPATSASQQRLFGMVHAYQKGKLKHAPRKIRQIAKHISKEDAEHFAKTKHDGLPERKDGDKKKQEKAAEFIRLLVKRGMAIKAAGQEVVVDNGEKKFVFPSITSAAAYLASLGGTPVSEIKDQLSERQPLINGMRVYYTSGNGEAGQEAGGDSPEAFGGEAYDPSGSSSAAEPIEFKLTGSYGSNYYG